MNYVDRKMFILFCISIWAFTVANLVGTMYLCYRADCPVESISQEDFDFEKFVADYVQNQYRHIHGEVKRVDIEWWVDEPRGEFEGKILIGNVEKSFNGSLRKYNTGWKIYLFHEVQR